MRKSLALFVLTFLLAASGVNAKVCFLPDILGGNPDCNDVAGVGCSYSRVAKCIAGYNEASCIRNGKTYYNCTCNTGANIVNNISRSGSTKYLCDVDFDSSCGCPNTQARCNSVYKYTKQECETDYPGTETNIGNLKEDEYCADPKYKDVVRFKSCECSEKVYPYDCKDLGLKPNPNAKCTDSSGVDHYSSCWCDDNWSQDPCAENANGCTQTIDHVSNGGITCYRCGVETCDDKIKTLNLDNYWCSAMAININCTSLGYQKPFYTEKCADGSVPLSCPFDSSYKFCDGAVCHIGDVFLSDGTCLPFAAITAENVAAWRSAEAEKFPIGVVYMLTDQNGNVVVAENLDRTVSDHGRVISLKDLRLSSSGVFDPANPYEGNARIQWGGIGMSLPLLPHADVMQAVLWAAGNEGAAEIYQGKQNTKKIINTPMKEGCTSAVTCSPTAALITTQFYPDQRIQTHPQFGAGNWYLPSVGEMLELVGMEKVGYPNTISVKLTGSSLFKVREALRQLQKYGYAEDLRLAFYNISSMSAACNSEYEVPDFNLSNSELDCVPRALGDVVRASLQF